MQDIDDAVEVSVGAVSQCGCEDHAADNTAGEFSLHLVLQGQDSAKFSPTQAFVAVANVATQIRSCILLTVSVTHVINITTHCRPQENVPLYF